MEAETPQIHGHTYVVSSPDHTLWSVVWEWYPLLESLESKAHLIPHRQSAVSALVCNNKHTHNLLSAVNSNL